MFSVREKSILPFQVKSWIAFQFIVDLSCEKKIGKTNSMWTASKVKD